MLGSRRIRLLGTLVALQAVAFVATSFVESLGTEGWHHVASLAGVLALTVVSWKRLQSRRTLAFGVLAFSALAAATGFWLLYWKEGIRAAGFQDWGVFWHVAWSWGALVFFALHTWINRVAFAHFVRRSFSRLATGGLHAAAYVFVLVAFAVTWSDVGKDWFTVESYVPFSLYAWMLVTIPPYGVWLAGIARQRRGIAPVVPWRGVVDLALVPAAALAILSGIPLTWFDPVMDANGWKYVSKFWHVWPSVLFTALVFVHSIQFWQTMGAHWRKFGIRVGDVPKPNQT